MPRIIGIDLGTTNSCVAVLERGAPTVLPSREGERTTPSVVAFLPAGGVAMGVPAKRQVVTNAERTVYGVKRLIGRKVNAPDVEKFARVSPFRIVAAPNGDAWIRLVERDVSPQEISSYVLERMRTIAEDNLGEPVTQAVVTVPAYFNDAQRQATKDAGKIAGLDVRRILNEPTAAALAFGVHKRKEGRQRVAVFDLGGGTFDISVLHVEKGVFEVVAVAGDAALGGDDFDRRIVEKLIEELAEQSKIDVAGDPMALGRLKEEAEKAKKALSDEPSTQIQLPFIGKQGTQPVHLERTLTRRELDEWTRDLVERLGPPCDDALRAAGLTAAELDDILLVGGMTRVPAVQAAVERIFGRRPSKGANPDEVVALGAAAHGAILSGEIEDIVLLDVTSHSLGIRVGASFATVIPRNTTVPARAHKLFATSQDDQGFVAVEVYQGESKDPRENRHLGRFVLDGLPRGTAGSIKVELSFGVDADGILSVSARELSTGKQTHVTLTPAGGLGEDELNRILDARRAAATRRK